MENLDARLIDELRFLFETERNRVQEKLEFERKYPSAFRDEHIDGYTADINNWRKKIETRLTDLLRYPPHHDHLKDKLKDFHQGAAFEKSVFIMTKFPEGLTPLDDQLRQVINAVIKGVEQCGFVPRLANQKTYYQETFKNVELYLLGSRQGVAIIEDVYKPELNPNVAIEWGWMRGMGKKVLYLREKNFKHERVDIVGLIKEEFDWKDPEKGIADAVKKFLE
jgi:hypothetical protein